MPLLYWEDRGADYAYTFDWTVGAMCTVGAAVALVGAWGWARRSSTTQTRRGAAVAVALASVALLVVAGVLVYEVAASRLFEGLFGRRSSDLVERFWWPVMTQVGVSVAAAVSVAGWGLRAARRGLGRALAVRHLCLATISISTLGYGVWLRPGEGLGVLYLDHPIASPIQGTLRWVHDSARYVPVVQTTSSRWTLEQVQSRQVDGVLEVEARAARSPLSSTRRFSIPLVVEDGDPRLPLAVGRSWRFEEVAMAPVEGGAPTLVPWDEHRAPLEGTIRVVGERWTHGRHTFEVQRASDGTQSEALTVYGAQGTWWASVPGRLREQSLVARWLGRCGPPPTAEGGPLSCTASRRRGWQVWSAKDDHAGPGPAARALDAPR